MDLTPTPATFLLELPLKYNFLAFGMRPRLAPFAGVFALLLLALPARAQQVTGALKIGGAVTSLSGGSGSTFDPRGGLAGGVALGYDFGNGLIVQPEVLYVIKGAYANTEVDFFPDDENDVLVPIRARFDLTYLEFPLLVTYRFTTRGALQPKLFAGPSVAFKLDARVRFRARGGTGPTQTEEDDTVENVDYGGVVGAGAEFVVGSQRLSLEARALLGQANVRMANPALHNVGVVFLLGIVF